MPPQHAWILYSVFKDHQKAKTELLTLFQIKPNVRLPLPNFWRPEFERPGKHFAYIHKYTLFLIDLLEASCDLDALQIVSRKISAELGVNDRSRGGATKPRGANENYLWPWRVWRALVPAYIRSLSTNRDTTASIRLRNDWSKRDFTAAAPQLEPFMFAAGSAAPTLRTLLQAHDLLAANDLAVATRCIQDPDASAAELTALVVDLYAEIFLACLTREDVPTLTAEHDPAGEERVGSADIARRAFDACAAYRREDRGN
ncbi:hypothetical protein BDK51DRAFT_38279 [Blyttiomyces helicus]|uniref:Uncharacterized protein n=1 Tax=Blyttiomyces helicus TaxID=388810 RepID=A0A4P9W4S9_9FUNG|nr:hypothetical protein BDK51DRAFT_38279 [Blyttiomyces helicus]|eukprot:RKO86922.1 hypothetical protein BDK51DRAFT_38279 [Blyttiomyces helicus]